MHIFSRRTGWDRTPTALAECLSRKRSRGERILDLTESNPTHCGLALPGRSVASFLDNPQANIYSPDPRGIQEAREAIARWYAQRGLPVSPESVLLTSGTSEAYSYLITLLCDAGDEILLPRPTYPLVELLAQAHDVHVKPYVLRYDGEWLTDISSLETQLSNRTRAVIVVHPNNPTGSYLRVTERSWLSERLKEANTALIADEVFWSYPQPDVRPVPSSFVAEQKTLTFVLNGLSKMVGLPHLKLSWIVVAGPPALRAEALERLEILADLMLSVSMPVQGAVAQILEESEELARPIRERVGSNLALIRNSCGHSSGIDVLRVEGGWNAVLRLPQIVSDEDWALMLLEQCGVLVHAGTQFDFSRGAHIVISALPQPSTLTEGMHRLVSWVRARSRA